MKVAYIVAIATTVLMFILGMAANLALVLAFSSIAGLGLIVGSIWRRALAKSADPDFVSKRILWNQFWTMVIFAGAYAVSALIYGTDIMIFFLMFVAIYIFTAFLGFMANYRPTQEVNRD